MGLLQGATAPFWVLLHVALVGLNHLLDHLAADAACLTGGQVAVVAFLQVDADLPWCSVSILKPCFYHIIGELCPFTGNTYCL